MNSQQHREISRLLDSIENLIKELVGFPSDIPFCFKQRLSDKEIRAVVKIGMIEKLKYEKSLIEFKENPEEASKLENIYQAIINCL